MTEIFQILIEQYKWDIEVFSQPWLYYWLLIPAMLFFFFFLVKWVALSAPIWIPIVIIINTIRPQNTDQVPERYDT